MIVVEVPAFYEVDSVLLQHINRILLCKCKDVTEFTSGRGCKELGQVARGSLWQWQYAIFWGLQVWTGAPHDN